MATFFTKRVKKRAIIPVIFVAVLFVSVVVLLQPTVYWRILHGERWVSETPAMEIEVVPDYAAANVGNKKIGLTGTYSENVRGYYISEGKKYPFIIQKSVVADQINILSDDGTVAVLTGSFSYNWLNKQIIFYVGDESYNAMIEKEYNLNFPSSKNGKWKLVFRQI